MGVEINVWEQGHFPMWENLDFSRQELLPFWVHCINAYDFTDTIEQCLEK